MSIKGIIIEFLVTLYLVLFLGLSRYHNQGDLLSVGLVAFMLISAMTYSFSHVSGAHFNPILSISLTITNQITIASALIYIVVQLIAGFGAGSLIYLMVKDNERGVEDAIPKMNQDKKLISVVLEAISMFLLVFVYNSLMNNPNSPKYIYGASIGGVYLITIVAFGFLNGGCLNLTFVLGPGVYSGMFSDIGFYLLGQLIGGLMGGTLYKLFLRKGDMDSEEELEQPMVELSKTKTD